jgi:hypothetical protein
MHKEFRALALCLLLLPQVVLSGESVKIDNSVLTMRIDCEIAIDPAGKVLDYRINTPMKAEVQQLLDKSVRKWTFHPVLVDNKPVAAKTRMRITLAAQAAGSGYRVLVDNVIFSERLDASERDKHKSADDGRRRVKSGDDDVFIAIRAIRPMPAYPRGLMQAGVEGAVLLSLKLAPDGHVEEAVAVQSSLFNVRGRAETLDKARTLLEDSTVRAAKRWTFEVTARKPNPTASDLTAVIPVFYRMSKAVASDAPGQWQVELRSEKRIAPWLLDAPAQNIGVSDLGDGEMLPVASAFRTPEGVLGKAL